MPIFGAKSRAARGCASKLACGRRINPHGARPFLRYVAASPQLPNGRTEASAPTKRFTLSPMVRADLQLHLAGESAALPPTATIPFWLAVDAGTGVLYTGYEKKVGGKTL